MDDFAIENKCFIISRRRVVPTTLHFTSNVQSQTTVAPWTSHTTKPDSLYLTTP